ncbi:MAG: aminoacyl-tRNA deacylase [Infirmifilum sp.]|uniref:aminoacyl-tRNA deacylase n=1 Tax=Infirmifilum sp. TaxID=2856575 RepID=UPI003D0B4B14
MLGPADLEAFLRRNGLRFQIVEVPAAATSEMASKSLGISKDKIAKSVLFVSEDNNVVLIVLRSDRRVDQSKLAKILGYKKLRLARDEEVLAYTGYPPGGVPPIGHLREIPVFLDVEVSTGEYWCGGGDDKHLLLLDFSEASKLKNVAVIEVPKKQ